MKSKLAPLGVLAVLCMMAPSLYDTAEATEYDTLLSIAEQAHAEIQSSLDRLNDVSPDVEALFVQGTAQLDALRAAIQDENPDDAKENFLAAMDTFRSISHMINDGTITDDATLQVESVSLPTGSDLTSKLERTSQYIENLRNVAQNQGSSIDFTVLDELVDLTKQQISSQDYLGAQTTIDQIHMILADIETALRQTSQEQASDRALQFAQKYLDLIDAMISEAEELGYPVDIIEQLLLIRDDLNTASDSQQIIELVKRVLALQEQFELLQLDTIVLYVSPLDEQITALADAGLNQADLDSLRMLFSELQSSIDAQDTERAQILLDDLVKKIITLQDSTS